MKEGEIVKEWFREELGSSIWPSDNPKDSPFNKFTCSVCGWSFFAQIYGSFPIGFDPYIDVKLRQQEHLIGHLLDNQKRNED